MSDQAIFFDPSRRRWWWIKRIATICGLFVVVAFSGFLVSLFVTQPLLPGMPGITSALVRAARRSVHFPRHQSEKRQFLLRKERGNLLPSIAKDQTGKAPKASRPPVAAPSIIAAFYAPWQETGLHSLRANAAHMTHLMPAWVHLPEGGQTLDYHDRDPQTNPHSNHRLQV